MSKKFKDFGDHIQEEQENPRLKELRDRESSLSQGEKTELMALRRFPENPRGQELATREAMGTLTQEEKVELMGLQKRINY